MASPETKTNNQKILARILSLLVVGSFACLAGGPSTVVRSAFPRTSTPSPKAIPDWPAELGGTLDAARPSDVKIVLVTSFQQELPSAAVDAMQQELADIFEPLAITPEWYRMTEVEGRTFPNRLIVVRFVGGCGQLGRLPVSHGALGHTHITEGEILPFIEVSCDRVLGFIQRSVSSHTVVAEQTSGVALARVLAHEIYHVVAATTKHGKTGLTREALTPEELTRGNSYIGGPESLHILRTLRPVVPGGLNHVVRLGP